MFFKQFYLNCLAHASYMLGSGAEAVVIDPQRDVDQYIEEAQKAKLTIKYVIETHLHADFVSGHRELAERTGAQIVFSAAAGVKFPHVATKNGDILKVGSLELEVLETPGHTMESICILVRDKSEPKMPAKLFSGDTLFIGDVGRPDLVAGKGHSAEEMAGCMYESLHNTLLKLADEVEVYPAHGAGSLCGKSLSSERFSTIGQERKYNYALQSMSREAFISMLTADQPEVPTYFPEDVELNRTGAPALSALPRPRLFAAAEAIKELQRGAIVLDLRNAADFAQAHIKGAHNIGLTGQFASWAGTFIEIGTPIILAADNSKQIEEAVRRLARVGIESVIGCMSSEDQSWCAKPFDLESNATITVEMLKESLDAKEDLLLLDVRRCGEFKAGHIENALNIPLAELPQRINEVPPGKKVAVMCAGGYRSSIAVGILLGGGVPQVLNVLGGFASWKDRGYGVIEMQPVTA